MGKGKGFVDLNEYKQFIKAILSEVENNPNINLGFLADENIARLSSRLQMEDFCRQIGKDYDELTEEDFDRYREISIDRDDYDDEL